MLQNEIRSLYEICTHSAFLNSYVLVVDRSLLATWYRILSNCCRIQRRRVYPLKIFYFLFKVPVLAAQPTQVGLVVGTLNRTPHLFHPVTTTRIIIRHSICITSNNSNKYMRKSTAPAQTRTRPLWNDLNQLTSNTDLHRTIRVMMTPVWSCWIAPHRHPPKHTAAVPLVPVLKALRQRWPFQIRKSRRT